MSAVTSPAARFSELRERAHLSHDEAALRMAISAPAVHDIENFENELSSLYSPAQVQKFCRVLGVKPGELFDAATATSAAPPVPAAKLASLFHAQCLLRGITLAQFSDAAGWQLEGITDPPERFLDGITLDGLKCLCRELGISWLQVIQGL